MLRSKCSRNYGQVLVGSQGLKHADGAVASVELLDTMHALVILLKKYLKKRILSSIT